MISVNVRGVVNWNLSSQVCFASKIDLLMRNLLSSGRLSEVFQGRQEGHDFIHASGRFKLADRQTYSPRMLNYYYCLVSSNCTLLPQLETAPEVYSWQNGMNSPYPIHNYIFPMLRLYQLWHGIPTDTYSAINNDDLNVAAQFQILYPYGGPGWNKLITPQNYICTTYPSTGEILFLPMSTYQHPRYLTTLRVYENAGQPLPLYSPAMYDSVDLYLTSDYAVFNNNVQIAFIDQLGLNDMNLEALHFKKKSLAFAG